MKKLSWQLAIGSILMIFSLIATVNAKVSEQTAKCLECHNELIPGLVDQW